MSTPARDFNERASIKAEQAAMANQAIKQLDDLGISGREVNKRARTGQLLRSLEHKPMTCNELADSLGYHYQTIYRDLKELMKSFQIYPTGQTRNGGILYKAGSSDNHPPELYHIEGAREVELMFILQGIISNNFAPSHATTSVDRFPVLMLRYLELCARLADGSPVTEETLNDLKEEMQLGLNRMKVVMSFFQQMLENDRRWTLAELTRIGSLPEYQYDQLKIVIDKFNASRYFNTGDNES